MQALRLHMFQVVKVVQPTASNAAYQNCERHELCGRNEQRSSPLSPACIASRLDDEIDV